MSKLSVIRLQRTRPMRRAGSLQVSIGLAGLVFTFINVSLTFLRSDTYKIRRAVRKFTQRQQPVPKEQAGLLIKTSMVDGLQSRLKVWEQHTTVLSGLYEAGKTTALQQALAGQRGVFQVTLNEQKNCGDAVYAALEVTGLAMFNAVLARVKKKLGKEPVLILDVPRGSLTNINTVSTFGKAFATDDRSLHVVGVLSSATAALGFDAGGPGRRWDLWMQFTEEEAEEFLKRRHDIRKPETAAKIIELVGTNPGRLQQAGPEGMAKAIEAGKAATEVLAAINPGYRKRLKGEVESLLAITIKDRKEQLCDVGREIAEALTKQDTVEHDAWRRKGIKIASVAAQIKDNDAHAVYFHTEEKCWRLVSKLHQDAVREQTGRDSTLQANERK